MRRRRAAEGKQRIVAQVDALFREPVAQPSQGGLELRRDLWTLVDNADDDDGDRGDDEPDEGAGTGGSGKNDGCASGAGTPSGAAPLALLVLVALLMLGGESIAPFSIALIVGIVVGTYSSIYVASATALLLGVNAQDLIEPVKDPELIDDLP